MQHFGVLERLLLHFGVLEILLYHFVKLRENLKIFLPASLVSCGASLVRFLDPADPTSSQSGNLTSASEPKDLLTEPANDAREVLSKTIPSI